MGLSISMVLPAGLTVRQSIRSAVLAEKAGLHRLWVTENLYTRGAFPILAAMAASTGRIRLATGTVSPLLRSPAALAMDVAALQEISEGRFDLGLGPGPAARLAAGGVPTDRPYSRFVAAWESLQAVLDGTADQPALEPPLATRPVRFYLAALGDRMLDTAGRRAQGLLMSMFCPPALLGALVGRARTAAAAAGRPAGEPEAICYVPISADDRDPAAARSAAADFLAENFARFESVPSYERMLLHSPALTLPTLQRIAADHRAGAGTRVPDEVLDDFLVSGSSEQCASALTRWAEPGLGLTELAFALCGGPGSVEATIEVLGALAAGAAR